MRYKTNLFPQHEQTSLEKITYFALHYLRYILVITQFVTICVFFYRFKVDQEIVNLKDTLSQKKAIVDTTQDLLGLVAELDLKISNINKLYTQQDSIKNVYGYLFRKLPPQMEIDNLTIDKDNVSLTGQTTDVSLIQSLYESIKSDKVFQEVDLGSINKSETGYTFTLELKKFILKNGS